MEELKKDHKSDAEFKKKKEEFEEDTSLPELENIQEEIAWLKMTLGQREKPIYWEKIRRRI